MSVDLVGKVGPRPGTPGNEEMLRLGNTTELIVGDAHGRYYEAVSRGSVFAVANQSGVTSQAGLSGTTPVLALFNPKGSGVNGVLIYAGCVHSVAFAAAAVIWLAANMNVAAADVTGTEATPRNALLGNNRTASLRGLTAATLPGAPVAVASLGVGLTGAITTIPSLQPLGKWFDGSVVLGPGSAISIQTSTASGASGLFCEFLWEEVPLPS